MLTIFNLGSLDDEWNKSNLFEETGWYLSQITETPNSTYKINLKNRHWSPHEFDVFVEITRTPTPANQYRVNFNGKVMGNYRAEEITKEMIIKGIREYIIETENK